jgi:hypothetical protein
VDVFGRAVRLYACDEWTKRFFAELGSPQDPDFAPPVDRYTELHPEITETLDVVRGAGLLEDQNEAPTKVFAKTSSSITRYIEAAKGKGRPKKDTKARYMQFDGVVLRFFLQWVDDWNGDVAKFRFRMSYDLAEEMAELTQLVERKGVVRPPPFMKKRRLPRFILAHDDRMRSCDDETGDEDYYTEDDFKVGATIEVFGRSMLIFDCDDFTQQWYMKNKGYDQRRARIDVSDPAPPAVVHAVPPPTMFGSDDDTLNGLKSLVPSQPRRSPRKENLGSTRYVAKMVTNDPVDRGREFRVTFYRDDQSVNIYEPPMRNSGVLGGNFLRRTRIDNPQTGRLFELNNFFTGAKLTINCFTFELLREDVEGKKGLSPTRN